MKTKRIPFNVELAKAGAKVVTRCGYPVRISDFNVKSKDGYIILGIIDIKGDEVPFSFMETGRRGGTETQSEYDLFIEEEINFRRMTNQELADWLRQCPEEHREFKYTGCDGVYSTYDYLESSENSSVERKLIRRNHGEWQEPLIEI